MSRPLLSSTIAKSPSRVGLAAQALERLEEMIVTHQLEPGSTWSEGALASLTGFGRTPVREALKRLENQHLVEIVQRHGVLITDLNVHKQLLLLETRRELERLVASLAARRRTKEESAQFLIYAQALRTAGKNDDVIAFFRAHQRSEALAIQASRNPFLAHAIAPCHAMSRRFYFLHYRSANDLRLACEHHALVMDAIITGEDKVAIKAADSLLDYVENLTRAALSTDL